MCKQVHQLIYDICPECKTSSNIFEFTGEINEVNVIDGNDTHTEFEYLYKCTECGARVWSDEQWINDFYVGNKRADEKFNNRRTK